LREYVPPPVGTCTIKDFNILYHVRVLPLKEDDNQEDNDNVDENMIFKREIVPTINKIWLKL